MDVKLFADLEPGTFQRHALHDLERDWPETNCYLDIWIEILAALGLPPESCLAYAVTQDFEGDQFTFFKVPLKDLQELYGLQVAELAVYDRIEHHVIEQIGRGRLSLVELDGYFLPETQGAGYRQTHGKTTVAVNRIDLEKREMDYFHNLGLHRLAGDDFDGVFQRGKYEESKRLLPYTEFVKFPDKSPDLDELAARSEILLRQHLLCLPAENPVASFARNFPTQAEKVSEREFEFFHLYAFNTLRQLGANFELFSSYLEWLVGQGRHDLSDGIAEAKIISSTCKMVQFKLARAVMRKNFQGLDEGLFPAVDAWDRLMQLLDAQYGSDRDPAAWLGETMRKTVIQA